jgi:hypothetical protein
MNNLLKFYNLNNNKKRTTTAYCTYLNNNRRKQNMAQREQLTLCSTQVNKHKWKHKLKNLFARELTSKKLILEETREPGLFKINVYTSK